MPPDPPACATCGDPAYEQRPRRTPAGSFYAWVCRDCCQVEDDVIRERNEEHWQ